MRALLDVGELASITFVLFALLLTGLLAASSRRLVDAASSAPPAVSVRRLRLLAALPLVGAALLTLIAFLPSAAATLAGVAHHCHSHAGHPHLCVIHPPQEGWSPIPTALIIGAVVVVGLRSSAIGREAMRGLAITGSLLRAARSAGSTLRVASSIPLCAAVGLWRPRVMVSDGFVAGVTEEALQVALAHERSHVARRDALWNLGARIAVVVLPGAARRRVLEALELATERACDEDAAREVGDRLVVADAILQARRLGLVTVGPGGTDFGPAQFAARVEALLAPTLEPPQGTARWDLRALAVLGLLVAGAGPLHHAVETALSILRG